MNLDNIHRVIDAINNRKSLDMYTTNELHDALTLLLGGEAELSDNPSDYFLIITATAVGVNALKTQFVEYCKQLKLKVTPLPSSSPTSIDVLINSGTRREKRFRFIGCNELKAINGLPIAKMFIDNRSIKNIRNRLEVTSFEYTLNTTSFFVDVPKVVV